jgi:DNA-binding MarR family transcriptional regulator
MSRELDDDLVSRLRMTVARLARLLRQQDDSGLAPTSTAMLAAIGREGPITLGDLAAHEQVAPPTITKSVDKLEAAGLVERVRDGVDRRVCRVNLTPVGRKQLDVNRSRRTAWLARQLRALPPEDIDALAAAVEVLERLTAAPEPVR